MKRFVLLFLFPLVFVGFLFCYTACAKPINLEPFISELRSDLFYGRGETLELKAGYGFRETPYVNDGKISEKISAITFRLLGVETTNTAYTLNFTYNGTNYSGLFRLNPISDNLTCEIPIENFSLKEFSVQVSFSSNTETIALKSEVPDGTISHAQALSFLVKNQSPLIEHYMDTNKNFVAEIHIRILVKDSRSYWYVGIASNHNLKALLIDGFSGEVLAIREIF